MSIDWLLANADGNHEASLGRWKAAERNFKLAVDLSKGEESRVQLLSMLDYAIALRMCSKFDQALDVCSSAVGLARRHFGKGSMQHEHAASLCDALAQPDLPFAVKHLFFRKCLGWLQDEIAGKNLDCRYEADDSATD